MEIGCAKQHSILADHLREMNYPVWSEPAVHILVAGVKLDLAKFSAVWGASARCLGRPAAPLPLPPDIAAMYRRKRKVTASEGEGEDVYAGCSKRVKAFLQTEKHPETGKGSLIAAEQQWLQLGDPRAFIALSFSSSKKTTRERPPHNYWPRRVDARVVGRSGSKKHKPDIRRLVWKEVLMLRGWRGDELVWPAVADPTLLVEAGDAFGAITCLVEASA